MGDWSHDAPGPGGVGGRGGVRRLDHLRRASTPTRLAAVGGRVSDAVSADGSPLAVYLALPAGDEPLVIHEAIGSGSSILELGSGPGRLTRLLVALGHRVTAVDDSPAMLAHVTGATTICADIAGLALGRRFDVVVAASHLINTPDGDRRSALLRTCADHLRADGRVIVERYPPGWLSTADATDGTLGPVAIEFRPGELRGRTRSASVTYQLADRRWTQRFEAIDLDDDQLAALAASVGLRFARTLDDGGAWVELRVDQTRPDRERAASDDRARPPPSGDPRSNAG